MSHDPVNEIVDWRPEAAPEETSQPAAERLIALTPTQRVRNVYADPSGQFFAGTWSSTPGKWQVAYTEHEFCRLLAGRIRIESETGEIRDYAAGDSFVIPAGFRGTWEVLETAEKQYVIFEPRA
jgi:uncharacterized cupin superfamily protein